MTVKKLQAQITAKIDVCEHIIEAIQIRLNRIRNNYEDKTCAALEEDEEYKACLAEQEAQIRLKALHQQQNFDLQKLCAIV
jgi:hypothetical protein